MSKLIINSDNEKPATVGSAKGKELAPNTSAHTDGLQDTDPDKAAAVQTPDNANVMPANEFGEQEETEAAPESNLSDKDMAYLKSESPALSQYSSQVTDSARPGDAQEVTFSRELQSLVNKYQQHASYSDSGMVSDMQSLADAITKGNSQNEVHERVSETKEGFTILQRQHGSDSTNTDNSLHRPSAL